MKEAGKGLKKEVKKINLNEVEDLADDMADLMEDMNEINEAMGRSYKCVGHTICVRLIDHAMRDTGKQTNEMRLDTDGVDVWTYLHVHCTCCQRPCSSSSCSPRTSVMLCVSLSSVLVDLS